MANPCSLKFMYPFQCNFSLFNPFMAQTLRIRGIYDRAWNALLLEIAALVGPSPRVGNTKGRSVEAYISHFPDSF